VSQLTALGWQAQIPLSHGLQQAYADFQASLASHSARSV
jgi:hypothetical protein